MNIADKYLVLREQAKALEKEMAHLKKEFLAMGVERLAADDYDLALFHELSERRSLDREIVEKFLTPEELALAAKVTDVSRVIVVANMRSK